MLCFTKQSNIDTNNIQELEIIFHVWEPVRLNFDSPPSRLYKNPFSLKLEKGFYFVKSF